MWNVWITLVISVTAIILAVVIIVGVILYQRFVERDTYCYVVKTDIESINKRVSKIESELGIKE